MANCRGLEGARRGDRVEMVRPTPGNANFDREAEYLMTPPPPIRNYKDGQAILVDEPFPPPLPMYPSLDECWRIFDKQIKERLDDRAKQPNFILCDWSDQEIYESLIEEDWRISGGFGMAMFCLVIFSGFLFVLIEGLMNG